VDGGARPPGRGGRTYALVAAGSNGNVHVACRSEAAGGCWTEGSFLLLADRRFGVAAGLLRSRDHGWSS